jgi:riboflavin synthase
MFTGIVQALGRIESVVEGRAAARLILDPGTLSLDDIAIGDSLAVNGCCLTVAAIEGAPTERRLAFDVSAETLACTTGLDAPGPANLEKALRLADRLGGHLLSGHVDGVGTIVRYEWVEKGAAGSRRLVVESPAQLARFIAPKGSIAVDGVSLTVNAVAGGRFEVNLIPHTLDVTTLAQLAPGGRVNLEVDLVARYVARLADYDGASRPQRPPQPES